jgi:hypothetical protein
MPEGNRFRHQAYTGGAPASPHFLLTPDSFPAVGSREFRLRMQEVGAAFRAGGVTAVYLVHGSCVGPDVSGMLAGLVRTFPEARPAVARLIRQTRPSAAFANYSEGYARLFEAAINPPDAEPIPVRLFEWSNENHHLGRADGAVRLVNCLATLEPGRPHRVLLWGHGHAGNVFALATNLLGGDREAISRFFEATDVYYRWPLARCVDIPVWCRVRSLLVDEGRLPSDVSLDVVTFGTPVRYGWESTAYERLVHFVHRRAVDGLPAWRAAFPPDVDDVIDAVEGDYIQQLAVAGTDSEPAIFAWRARLADRRLKCLLESGLEGENPADRFRAGTIVPEEGTTLLVDYGPPEGDFARHHAGHAVYTGRDWLLFHAEEVCRLCYSAKARQAA